MRKNTAAVFALFVFLSLVSLAEGYDNRKYGFSINPPEKWVRLPIKPEEKWIVAKFKSDRSYPTEGGYEHTPMMKVILFPAQKPEDEEGKEGGDGEPDIVEILKAFSNPYKDYKDYLKKNFDAGGYFVSSEKDEKYGSITVTKLEITVEKLARYGKQRIVTWIFHTRIGDFAVETDLMETYVGKLAPAVLSSLNTFKTIKRDKSAAKEEEEEAERIKAAVKNRGKALTPEERKKARMEAAERILAKAKQDLPAGWAWFDTEHFLVVYHTPRTKADRSANQAESCRAWLNATFGHIGTEYCPRCVLRVCKNWDEEKAYRDSSAGTWAFENREITTNVESGEKKFEFEYINRMIVHKFFSDKNELLWEGLPLWLEKGLDQYIGTAIAKGKQLMFEPDNWERDRIKEARKQGNLMKIKDLLLKADVSSFGSWNSDSGQAYLAQCGSLVRYFMGPGNKDMTKDVIFKYLKNLITILEEKEKEREKQIKAAMEREAKEGDDRPMTEEEEEEEFRKRKASGSMEAFLREKRDILDKSLSETFKGWKDPHWQALNDSWNAWSK